MNALFVDLFSKQQFIETVCCLYHKKKSGRVVTAS